MVRLFLWNFVVLQNIGIQNRALSIEDAADYLSEELQQRIYATDIYSLIQQKKLKPSCYVNGAPGRLCIQYCPVMFPIPRKVPTGFRAVEDQLSHRSVKDLKGELKEAAIIPSKQYERNKRASLGWNDTSKSQMRIINGFKAPVWLQGIYEIYLNEDFLNWIGSVLASSIIFDLHDFTLQSDDGHLVKIVEYSNNGNSNVRDQLYQSIIRLEVSDLRIQFEHIQDFVKYLKTNKSSNVGSPKKSLILEDREVVARAFVEQNKTKDLRSLTTIELWKGFHTTATKMNQPNLDADRLFSQSLVENTILKILKQFRDRGIDIPLRR